MNKIIVIILTRSLSKFRILLFIYISLVANGVQAHDSQARLKELRELNHMWVNGQYKEVAPRLGEYRKGPFGKNIIVDYMLGTSWCRIPGEEAFGKEWLQRKVLPLANSDDETNTIKKEIENCGSQAPPREIEVTSLRGSSVTFRGKGYSFRGEESLPTATGAVKFIRSIPYEELSARLFEPSRRKDGISHVQSLLGPGFRVLSVGHFIIASSSGHSTVQLTSLGRYLEKYLSFYASQYSMPIPSDLITVYLVPNETKFHTLAARLHGLNIERLYPDYGIIGYSFPEDMSIVSITPRTIYGTLNHELFHLMVRQNFGDIPPWLEEGIAALYESSKIVGDRIQGVRNWRFNVLDEHSYLDEKPGEQLAVGDKDCPKAIHWVFKLQDLMKMNWDLFNDPSGMPPDTDINLDKNEWMDSAFAPAMARSFALYLQDKQQLVPVYNAFRNNEAIRGDILVVTETPVSLLEKTLHKPISEINAEFLSWLANEFTEFEIQKYRIRSSPHRGRNSLRPAIKRQR